MPETLGDLTRLQDLSIFCTQITVLPKTLSRLTELSRLSLCGNKLTELPESLGNLIKLHKLELDGNQIERIPESFAKLVEIEELILGDPRYGGNPLTEIPNILRAFRNLQTLEVIQCNLTFLPDWLGELTNLVSGAKGAPQHINN